MEIRTGYPDIPIEDKEQNRFKTGPYVEALADFILECDTPMTVAIQGDWGTGKTSMINLVNQRIKDQVFSFTFNTWQYSQFDLGNDLPALLLNRMARELAGDVKGKPKITKTDVANATRGILKTTFGLLAGLLPGGGSVPDDIFEQDMIRVIESIRSQFEAAIKNKADNTVKKRVVVFVDDLDRLEPEKAVEILEVLKLFLDCRQCVFVLAVDYSVVTQGVRAKYGESIGEEKGKSFFDKIIQLPFKMPVARYDIKDYLTDLMGNIWGEEITEDEQEDVDNYLRIIENTIGKNPRSIKRIVNSFMIVEKVANLQGAYAGREGKPEGKKNIQKLLFALLCIQLAWENLYNYLIEHADDIDEKFGGIQRYVDSLRDDEEFEKLLAVIYPEKKILRGTPLFKELDQTIEIYCDWVLDVAGDDENGSEEVLNVLQLSSITANNETVNVQTGKKTMPVDAFFAPMKDNPILSWMIEETALLEQKGMAATAYRRDKSGNYLRFETPDRLICDCVAAKQAGWSVFCHMEESEERKDMMKKIESSCGAHVSSVKDTDKNWFVVRGVKEKEVFEEIIDLL